MFPKIPIMIFKNKRIDVKNVRNKIIKNDEKMS